MLECNYFSDNSIKDEREIPKNIMKITAENISTLHDSWNTKSLHKESCVKTRVALLKSLADNQESLGKCVQIFSRTFGLAILFILASCMMHLVLAAYFLLLALLSRNVTDYVWDQVIWIVLHILRLILVVEPCHIATTESKKTIEIMSELKREVSEPLLIEE
ncbi:PREDICTED: gustatory receptor for sugar taste 43a-like, partial [Rhagoletis zephyria]|uniref:gustatory receptor for sugar taste 43a-like n=1 Tax=Rhagoletis zephyria TaxID=28612 RepID=UPI0008116A9F